MNLNVLYDSAVNFVDLGVQGEWDVANVPEYTGGIWQVIISSITYNVYTALPDGGVVLSQTSPTLPSSTTTVSYTLLDPLHNVQANSISGSLQVSNRGNIHLTDIGITTLSQYVMIGDYVKYSGQEYQVCGIVNSNIQISNYTSGGVGSASVSIKRRLIENGVGYFGYSGLMLNTIINYEAKLGNLNGSNPPLGDLTDNSLWKENFLVNIGSDFFKITNIDKTSITLDGLPYNWTTLTAGGTAVNFEIHHFIKEPVSVEFVTLDQIDRSGKDPVIRETLSTVEQDITVVAFQAPSGNEVEDIARAKESISFEIEWKDGRRHQGDIL